MAYPTQNYFQLRWGSGTTTRYFKLQLAEAHPDAVQHIESNKRAIDGNLLTVKAALVPRIVMGNIKVGAAATGSYGTLADLKNAYLANDLECLMWGDGSTWWNAKWIGSFDPEPMDPLGNWFRVPVQLEQRS
jgi:hypothetical protein